VGEVISGRPTDTLDLSVAESMMAILGIDEAA
jgi:hypothetical protein